MRYISELEHKVQTLQTEATTLSAQLTLLQVGGFWLIMMFLGCKQRRFFSFFSCFLLCVLTSILVSSSERFRGANKSEQ